MGVPPFFFVVVVPFSYFLNAACQYLEIPVSSLSEVSESSVMSLVGGRIYKPQNNLGLEMNFFRHKVDI